MLVEGNTSIGQGFHVFSGQTLNQVFDLADAGGYWETTQEETIYQIRIVETAYSVFEYMNMSASAAYGGIIGGGSLSVSAANSLETTDTSLSILASVRHEIGTKGIRTARMLDEVYSKVVQLVNLRDFASEYGTGLITQETYGGQLGSVNK
jgi:hypothetical protein